MLVQCLINTSATLVNTKRAVASPNTRTVKTKYLCIPLMQQENPRYFWWPSKMSRWWYPDLKSVLKKKSPLPKRFWNVLKSSYLNFWTRRCLLIYLRSKINLNCLPLSATDKGLTVCTSPQLISFTQPWTNSLRISEVTKSGWFLTDWLFSKTAGSGFVTKSNAYPFPLTSKIKSLAPICCQKESLSASRPFTFVSSGLGPKSPFSLSSTSPLVTELLSNLLWMLSPMSSSENPRSRLTWTES